MQNKTEMICPFTKEDCNKVDTSGMDKIDCWLCEHYEDNEETITGKSRQRLDKNKMALLDRGRLEQPLQGITVND